MYHHQSIERPPNNEMPQSTSKKKRNLPGNPDPEAEVVALSPGDLMATNRFVCEICNKGFQRDQNLQLHRRGHNLPWKLKQRNNNKEVVIKKRLVYVCPETSCVHHHPSRALGDLTGIKKHFCRKHGEKKWTCDKCSKRYALQSDLNAHSKICGTRDYRCDHCGTLFSRKDSFITHRAFCDILAEESSKSITQLQNPLFNSNTSQTPPNNFNYIHLPQWLSSPPEPGPRVEQSISPNPNNYNMSSSPSPMSATALLQKATHEMGVTMSSTKAGPHQYLHMGAPRFYATTTTSCEEMGTGFVNVTSSCMQNIQDMNMVMGSSSNLHHNNDNINSNGFDGDSFYNGILNQKQNGSEHLVGGGGGGDGLPTRDFLGLRGFPNRDLFGLHQMGTSSNYHLDKRSK